MFSVQTEINCKKTEKGVQNLVLKQITHKEYRNTLLNNTCTQWVLYDHNYITSTHMSYRNGCWLLIMKNEGFMKMVSTVRPMGIAELLTTHLCLFFGTISCYLRRSFRSTLLWYSFLFTIKSRKYKNFVTPKYVFSRGQSGGSVGWV